MGRNKLASALVVVLVLVFGALSQVRAQAIKTILYPSMAPLNQYMMERSAEIALARTAAPEDITRDATILVMGSQGYETAVEGKNGFVCVVERAWMAPFDKSEFWNPRNRSPVCYNPPAARSVLSLTKMRTEMVLAGLSKDKIIENLKAAKAQKESPLLEPGGMAYMMSKQGYLTDQVPHNLSHVMFFVPTTDPATWGANSPLAPVGLLQQDAIANITTFLIPVGTWSDGTAASSSDGAASNSHSMQDHDGYGNATMSARRNR
jgi:hypothetical protein